MFGRWETTPETYAEEVRRWQDVTGNLQWAAIQDWMCEPFILQKTGKTVREHQARTIESYLALTRLAPECPWVPVIQGWRADDYLDHVDQYQRAGIDLAHLPLVGVGSVCRRQNTEEALEILRPLRAMGLALHGFGFKVDGLRKGASLLASADSMAWSRAARYGPTLPGCTHKTCANCIKFAMKWREKVLRSIRIGEREYQGTMW